MTSSSFLDSIRSHRVAVSHRTQWFVTEISTGDGVVGLGECSDLREPAIVDSVLQSIMPLLSNLGPDDDLEELDLRMTERLGHPESPTLEFQRRLVLGSVMAALCDISARRQGIPLWQWLGATGREQVALYANINRAPVERRSDEFASVAIAAVTAGFSRIKLAPFDGPALAGSTLLDTGIAHLRAVRDAVGPDPTIYVDLHHRLSRPDLLVAIDAMEALGVAWIEDAVDVLDPAALTWLREATDIPLAGGEKLTRAEDVTAAVKGGMLSYLLLDPKYVGGPLRMRSLLHLVDDTTVTFHDPTSPVSTAVSAHLAGLPSDFAHVEYAFGEPIDRRTMVAPTERIADGVLTLAPGPGSGIALQPDALAGRITTREWVLARGG